MAGAPVIRRPSNRSYRQVALHLRSLFKIYKDNPRYHFSLAGLRYGYFHAAVRRPTLVGFIARDGIGFTERLVIQTL